LAEEFGEDLAALVWELTDQTQIGRGNREVRKAWEVSGSPTLQLDRRPSNSQIISATQSRSSSMTQDFQKSITAEGSVA
jgi:hypothetical protein